MITSKSIIVRMFYKTSFFKGRLLTIFVVLTVVVLLIPSYPLPFNIFIWLLSVSGLLTIGLCRNVAISKYLDFPRCTIQEDDRSSHLRIVIGYFLLIGMLAFLEWRQPFYFTQDDNHSQFLPIINNALAGFFRTGIFPTWDAYQGFGMVLGGVYDLTYPPLYLAYGIACALGNSLYTLDVFAWIHLSIGYWLTCTVLKKMHVPSILAIAAALAIVLNGYILTTGRSWYIILPVVVYLPGLLWSLWRFQINRVLDARWVWLTAFNHGLWFHSGHAQLWFYGMSFWGIGMLLLFVGTHERWKQNLRLFFAAILLVFAFSQPLFYLMFWHLHDYSRIPLFWGGGIFNKLGEMIVPWPLLSAFGIVSDSLSANFYINSLLFLSFLIVTCCWLIHISKIRFTPPDLQRGFILFLAVVALLWAFGNSGGIWWILSFIPPFCYMNSPHKLFPFVNFFIVVTGILFLARICELHASFCRKMPLLAGLIISLTLYNTYLCHAARFNFGAIPYPVMPETLKTVVSGLGDVNAQRVISQGKTRSANPIFPLAMLNDYATYYEVISANGYDDGTMGSANNRFAADMARFHPFTFMREYGIGWQILFRGNVRDWNYPTGDPVAILTENIRNRVGANLIMLTGDKYCYEANLIKMYDDSIIGINYPDANIIEKRFFQKWGVGVDLLRANNNLISKKDVVIDSKNELTLHRVKNDSIKPLVYAERKGQVTPLPFRIAPNGIIIDTAPIQKQSNHITVPITANFLFRREFFARDDRGKPIPLAEDNFRRMRMQVPASSRTIFLAFVPPWKTGMVIGMILAGLALLLLYLPRYRRLGRA